MHTIFEIAVILSLLNRTKLRIITLDKNTIFNSKYKYKNIFNRKIKLLKKLIKKYKIITSLLTII